MVVLAAVLAAMGAMVLQLRCVDAATEAARLAARGDPEGARRAAARLLPGGAEVSVEVRGDDVVARVRAPPLGSALPAVRVAAEATASREPASVAAVEGPDPLAGAADDGGAGTTGEPPASGTPPAATTAAADVPPTGGPPLTEPLPGRPGAPR
ncbi:hypothetical protein C8D89_10641 [Actinomycetospora cinnamomea]|uniref:TadE-like protein n=1 Tax=Actinomycetospora cinnamomea TaxID=663609 RepID=A0A2U1FB22_9PSEU|nr:hypothetical protein C8D89_10641 [Actinomycetospora cinnamomea]